MLGKIDLSYMSSAISTAQASGAEIPVGAVITAPSPERNGELIIASAHNLKEALNDVTAHAEILALREASRLSGSWRLEDCVMYVTLEPCPMCAWAILQARLKAVYFGSYDPNYGALGSKIDLRQLANSKLRVYGGIMEKECDEMLREYFDKIRKRAGSDE
jgi:tRNA(adenine34) deaminase